MKNILLSILKFEVLFVPCYVALSFFQPAMKARLLENGIVSGVLSVALTGLAVGTILVVGVALLDKSKKKKEDEEA